MKRALIMKRCPIKSFKELMIEYELVMVTKFLSLMKNDKLVSVTLFSITVEDKCGNDAHSFYIKDPYFRDTSLDQPGESRPLW